ncbi:MAG TPA: hypothetical protein P5157_02360 [Paludibacteraceae bacterium]|nr:hypothetical protein [Paludibacteraceae bacterium]HON02283.1 hypothetical protein [Paludibacteraceae bacterium]HRS23727.1 hypothetical protein [Paludibacteraceae bacterium]
MIKPNISPSKNNIRYYFGTYEKDIDKFGNITQTDYIYTPAGVIGTDQMAGHAVNVVSFKVADKLNWFGGGFTPFLKMNTVSVWDPLSASVRRLTEEILKLEFIKY